MEFLTQCNWREMDGYTDCSEGQWPTVVVKVYNANMLLLEFNSRRSKRPLESVCPQLISHNFEIHILEYRYLINIVEMEGKQEQILSLTLICRLPSSVK